MSIRSREEAEVEVGRTHADVACLLLGEGLDVAALEESRELMLWPAASGEAIDSMGTFMWSVHSAS